MRKLLFALPLLLAACNTVPAPVAPTVVIPSVQEEVSKPVIVSGTSWSITLPPGWEVKDRAEEDDHVRTIMGGQINGSNVVIAVSTMDLEGELLDADFGEATIVVMVELGLELLDAKRATVDNKPGSVVLFKSPEGQVLFQYAVGSKRVGHIAACGGRVGVTILQRCKDVLDTLKIK